MDEKQVRMLRVIWIAMLNAVLIYLVMAFFFVKPETPRSVTEAIGDLQTQVLYGLGLLMLVLSAFVPRMLLRPENGRVPFESVKKALVVKWSLADAVAIFGLLAAFLGHSPGLYAPMGVIALTAILFAFPSDDLLESYTNAQ